MFYPSAQETKALQARIHELNFKWWHDAEGNRLDRNKGELLCLIHSEISEGSQGVIGSQSLPGDMMDDHLPHRRMDEVEMADATIRIHDYAEGFGYDLGAAMWDMIEQGWVVTWANIGGLSRHAQMHMSISNAMEGERKNRQHDKFPHRKAAEVHLAFALMLIRHYCVGRGYDLDGAVDEKLTYNVVRKDHTHEARAQADGKKW